MLFDNEDAKLHWYDPQINKNRVYHVILIENPDRPEQVAVVASWGRANNGRPNQRQVKICCGRLHAERTFYEWVHKKTKKGYVERTVQGFSYTTANRLLRYMNWKEGTCSI